MSYLRAHYQELIAVFFVLVLIGNVMVFISSMTLSSEINQYELQTNTLTQENIQLEKQLADDMSFKKIQTYQQSWGFKQAVTPLYVGEPQIALNSIH